MFEEGELILNISTSQPLNQNRNRKRNIFDSPISENIEFVGEDRKFQDSKDQTLSESPILEKAEKKKVRKSLTPEEGVWSKRRKYDDGKKPEDKTSVPKVQLKRKVISSLFKSNPDIPNVERLKVEPTIEKVFSSKSFKDLPLHPFMISNLEDHLGYKQLTSIQEKTIPVILKGKDMMIKSQTGSGKTLAFAIPIVQSLQALEPKINRSDGIYAIIIVPTRELAVQTFEIFQKLVKPFVRIVPGCLMGGEKKKAEKARLRKGVNILISTPGRLLDHAQNTSSVKFSQLNWLVLDEADRLLDLGYEKNVAAIIDILNEQKQQNRQTLLLSATLTEGVKQIAGMSLNNPVHIDVVDSVQSSNTSSWEKTSSSVETFTMPENLKHFFTIVPAKLRLVVLSMVLQEKSEFGTQGKMLIFLTTQDSVDFHFELLKEVLVSPTDYDSDEDDIVSSLNSPLEFFKLHGNMSQQDRIQIFQKFRDVTSGVLLCTDVASRGLDLPKVDWIIQYNPPCQSVDYIHRVGRTARIGSHGQALIFLLPSEVEFINVLEEYNVCLTEIKYHTFLEKLASPLPDSTIKMKQRSTISIEDRANKVQQRFERCVNASSNNVMKAQKAYLSFIRSYATYPQHLKKIFHRKNIHLGHLAKSFGLRDTPKDIGQTASQSHNRNKKQLSTKVEQFRNVTKKPSAVFLDPMSEFASGLQELEQMNRSSSGKKSPSKKSKFFQKRRTL